METKDTLKMLRLKNNYSQQKLSELTGISKTILAELETGKRNIGLSILTKLADFYSVSLDYIMGREVVQELDDRTDIERIVSDNHFSDADEEILKQGQENLVRILKQKQSELEKKQSEIDELRKENQELRAKYE